MKKSKSLIALLVLIIVLVSSSVVVLAANSDYWPALSSSKYAEYQATETIRVYQDKNCKTPGVESPQKAAYNAYISPGDKCYIYTITSEYAKINYPSNRGRLTGYAKTADLFDTCVPWISYATSKKKTTTYKSRGGKSIGYIESGDTVFTLRYIRGYVSVLYTAKSGKRAYKFGWVKQSDLSIKGGH